MKSLIIFVLLAISTGAFGAIPFDIPNNDMKFGDGDALSAKSLELKMGLGASNPIFSSPDGTEMEINIPFRAKSTLAIEGNEISIGDGTAQDLSLKYDINGTADIPEIKYDDAVGELVFKSKVGANFKKFGTGSGGGGGENFNNAFTTDDNANAEDGTTGWTNSGGTFAITTSDPLEGEQSFIWTPSAQNDTLDSAVLDFDKDIFKGRSCQIQIEYIGGDENLTLQVIDADNDILGSQVLNAHTISAVESAFFICPKMGLVNDFNIRLRLINTGASASPLIKFDKSYAGTLIGLSESVLPDVFSAYIDDAGLVSKESSNFIDSCSITGTGVYTCNFVSGVFSVPPNVNCTSRSASPVTLNGCEVDDSISASQVVITVEQTNAGGFLRVNNGFFISAQKQGTDAKQSVQVYKSIPKVSENVNTFSFEVNSSGNIISKTPDTDWIAQTSTDTFGLNPDRFSKIPDVAVTFSNSPPQVSSLFNFLGGANTVIGLANNNLVIRRHYPTVPNGPPGQGYTVIVNVKKEDLKMPTVQPIIVGQVTNSYAESASKNVRVEACIINAGTGTPIADNDLCESWVDSITDIRIGEHVLNFKSGTFSDVPICVCIASGNTFCSRLGVFDSNQWSFRTTSGSTRRDLVSTVICMGEK